MNHPSTDDEFRDCPRLPIYDLIDELRPRINRVELVDWEVRVQLPRHLELAELAGPAAELRALPPLSGITDRGRLVGWPGIVKYLRTLHAQCLPLRSDHDRQRVDFFLVNGWLHSRSWESSDEEVDHVLALGVIGLEVFGSSALAGFLPGIVLSCDWYVCSQHARAGGTTAPEKLVATRRELAAELLEFVNLDSAH